MISYYTEKKQKSLGKHILDISKGDDIWRLPQGELPFVFRWG